MATAALSAYTRVSSLQCSSCLPDTHRAGWNGASFSPRVSATWQSLREDASQASQPRPVGGTRVKGRKRNGAARRGSVSCAVHAEVAFPPLQALTASEPEPVCQFVKAFAPATVANLGPGFDFLGCAVQGLGDYVTAEISTAVSGGEVAIESIVGDGGRLSLVADQNCIGIAAKATMELLGVTKYGVSLSLTKGLPLGSGLGSSAASAAAAAMAVNALFGNVLSKASLVTAGLRSEAVVSGYHADNVGPAIMGGFVLIRSYDPLEILSLSYPEGKDLFFVVASPAFEAPTKAMRAALPSEISMKAHVANSSQAAALVAAILTGDAPLLGSALSSDKIVEPRRGPLIPGLSAVKVAASAIGAYGCTISGAGPTAVAITDDREKGERIGEAMVEAFMQQGKLRATVSVQLLDREGARVVERSSWQLQRTVWNRTASNLTERDSKFQVVYQ